MTVAMEYGRGSSRMPSVLEDRFEVIKEIGDGSFGSVVLARVRTAGANVARRGTMVAIKTMKKSFDSFTQCLELREVIFLRKLPIHVHLVPALDIFLDPLTRKLHICMEYMDGNLYQLMKARDHKCLDAKSVKSILYQILSGLDHIHSHHFFHRDIKPENILVSTSAPHDFSSTFSRYSALATPPSTPPAYSIKIADFGLARETHSKVVYTTYVSTRWYRAPEVLLRAGEYSAPVDIWALGAMAVEIATLKPLFPGGNEVDQVWRVCEIMGSPGNWYTKAGTRVGGGEWREGTKLAQKLGFSFPKMAPHSMDTILQPPQWPLAFSNFVTWCLMWDSKNRPTSKQALEHEFFTDALDPLRPKSSASRLLGRKHSDLSPKLAKETSDSPTVQSKPSWFRRSLIGKESAQVVPTQDQVKSSHVTSDIDSSTHKARPAANKRATWTNGAVPSVGAPMPILPSIRPVSPLSNAVTAQASLRLDTKVDIRTDSLQVADEKSKKIGRQLSINSGGNHYSDGPRKETEQTLNANTPLMSPSAAQKEGFFSHLRKRARRLSGRHGLTSPNGDDVEAAAGTALWSNRSSIIVDSIIPENGDQHDFTELDKALQNVKYSLDRPQCNTENRSSTILAASDSAAQIQQHLRPQISVRRSSENVASQGVAVSSRTRRAPQISTNPIHQFDPPAEEDELLDEVLNSTSRAMKCLDYNSPAAEHKHRSALVTKDSNRQSMLNLLNTYNLPDSYPTPSPSAKRNGIIFGQAAVTPSQPLPINQKRSEKSQGTAYWPTPPYDENEWATAATSSTAQTASYYR